MNFVSGLLKVCDFSSIIISHILHRLLLHLVTPLVVFSPNVEEVSILFKIFGLSLTFNDFCCVLYFFDFVIVFKFFLIFHYYCE